MGKIEKSKIICLNLMNAMSTNDEHFKGRMKGLFYYFGVDNSLHRLFCAMLWYLYKKGWLFLN